MKGLLILGAGGHGAVVKDVAKACGYDNIEFLDDNNHNALGKISDLKNFREYESVFVSIGDNIVREKLLDIAENLGFKLPSLIHPDSYVSSSAKIDEAVLVEPGAIINSNVEVGKGTIVSVGAIIDHNAKIGEFVHVNAGAIVKSLSCIESFRKLEIGERVK